MLFVTLSLTRMPTRVIAVGSVILRWVTAVSKPRPDRPSDPDGGHGPSRRVSLLSGMSPRLFSEL